MTLKHDDNAGKSLDNLATSLSIQYHYLDLFDLFRFIIDSK